MTRSSGLAVALALSSVQQGCFNPSLDFCRSCDMDEDCGEGGACHGGACIYVDRECIHHTIDPADARVASSSVLDARVEPSVGSGACEERASASRCLDRCCIADRCLDLPSSVRAGLVLWFDGSASTSVDGETLAWCDRSPYQLSLAEAARADAGTDAAPRSITLDGLPALQFSRAARPMRVEHRPEHDLGTHDFVMFFTLALANPRSASCIAAKGVEDGFLLRTLQNGAPSLRVIVPSECPTGRCPSFLEPADTGEGAAPGLQLLTIRRIYRTRLELRRNGVLLAERSFAEPLTLGSVRPLLLGGCAETLPASEVALAAFVLVRATIGDVDLALVEQFLMASFQSQ